MLLIRWVKGLICAAMAAPAGWSSGGPKPGLINGLRVPPFDLRIEARGASLASSHLNLLGFSVACVGANGVMDGRRCDRAVPVLSPVLSRIASLIA